MRNDTARISTATLALVLLVAAGPAGASLVDPSVEITGGVAGICDNSGGGLNPNVPTLLTYSALASDTATMSVAGVGTVAASSEDLPFFPVVEDMGTYGFTPSVYSVPPGTQVTAQIVTYFGPGQSGGVSFVSTVVFDCDTGAVISLVSGPPAPPIQEIPTLGALGLVGLALLLGAASVRYLRARRPDPSAGS